MNADTVTSPLAGYLTRLTDTLDEAKARHDARVENLATRVETPAVMDRVDRVLDLGSGSLLGDLTDMSKEQIAETFEILADLFDRGIVGYEVREINGEPQKVFIDVAIGSDAHRAPLYRDGRLDTYL